MPDVDIAVNIGGNMVSGLKSIQEATRKYKSDVEGLQKKLDELNRVQSKVKTELDKAKKEASDAAKGYKEFGDEVSKAKSEAANFKLRGMQDEFEAVSKAARQTKKDMEALTTTQNKMNNRSGGSLGGALGAAKGIFVSQGVQAIGQLATEAGTYIATSAFGQEAGNVIGGALSSAVSMAMAGFAIGGPVGAAIGAGIGVITGAVSGEIQNEQNRDEFFKGIVQEEYSNSKTRRAEVLERGSATAGQRELDAIAFKKLIGEDSEDYLEWVKQTGAATPFEYGDLTSLSKTMATYGYNAEEMKDLLIKIGDTGANLGLDASGMSMLATGLGRMKSSNKTSLEYLNLLLERGVPVIDYLSEGLGKSKDQIYDMVSKGLIPGSEAAQIIADAMGEDNFGAMDEMSKTYSGLMSTIEDFWTNMEAAQGEAYNNQRKPFLENYAEWTSEYADEMEAANKIVGEIEATQKNQQDFALKKAYEDIFNSDAYKIATAIPEGATVLTEEQIAARQEVAIKMATVEAEANAEYMKTEGAQLREDAEIEIIGRIQEAVMGEWYEYGRKAQVQMNLGRMAVGETVKIGNGEYGPTQARLIDVVARIFGGSAAAYGLTTVPYDNFPAMLHQGEAVLTASQARQWREGKGGNGSVVISGNQFTVREDADIVRIAEELLRQLEGAKEGYVGA